MKTDPSRPSASADTAGSRRLFGKIVFSVLALSGVIGGWWVWTIYAESCAESYAIQALLKQAEDGLRDSDLAQTDEALERLRSAASKNKSASWKETGAALEKDRTTAGALDEVFARRWAILGTTPDVRHARRAYARIFAEYDIDIARMPVDLAAKTIRQSRISARLLTALDAWLEAEPKNARVLDVLKSADPDFERGLLRAAIAANDQARLTDHARSARGKRLPAATAFLFGLSSLVPDDDAISIVKNSLNDHPRSHVLTLLLARRLMDKGSVHEAAEHSAGSRNEADRLAQAAKEKAAGIERSNRLTQSAKEKAAEIERSNRLTQSAKEKAAEIERANRLAQAAKEKAAEIERADRLAQAIRGNLLFQQKLYDEAIPVLRTACALNPRDSVVHAQLGLALNDKARFEEAIPALRKAVELGAVVPSLHANLGWALNMRGRFDDAIPVLRKAIELEPKSVGAYINLGGALSARRNLDEAIDVLQEAVKLAPANAQAHNNLGGVLYARGRHDEAIIELRKAIELDAGYLAAHLNLSWAYNAKGQLDDAIAILRQACEIDADNAMPRLSLGFALFHNGDVDESLFVLRGAQELTPTPPTNSAWRTQALAWLQADLSQWRKHLDNSVDNARRARLSQKVRLLQEDAAFEAIRNDKRLAELPNEERAAWRQFWAEVRMLHDELAGGK